jgi:hypothetical protein
LPYLPDFCFAGYVVKFFRDDINSISLAVAVPAYCLALVTIALILAPNG